MPNHVVINENPLPPSRCLRRRHHRCHGRHNCRRHRRHHRHRHRCLRVFFIIFQTTLPLWHNIAIFVLDSSIINAYPNGPMSCNVNVSLVLADDGVFIQICSTRSSSRYAALLCLQPMKEGCSQTIWPGCQRLCRNLSASFLF